MDEHHGPWINLSHCGFGKFDPQSNTLTEVNCPSRYCATWVRLVDGKLAEHERTRGGPCPWIGVRVVDDRPDPLAVFLWTVQREPPPAGE